MSVDSTPDSSLDCSVGCKGKKVIHVDMDCFYAAVAMREDPSLLGKPVAVGGRASGRGVLSTCNYEARAFGLHSAMPTHRALQLCPDLILVPSNFELYREISAQVREIFEHYASSVEPLSLDEAYLDVSDSPHCNGSATLIAQQIRQEIFAKTQLTASAGVAPLKFLAKIASDINKPNGLFVIKPSEVEPFIEQLALEKISGIGKVSIEKLHQQGFYTGADVRASSAEHLHGLFGRMGEMLWRRCHGIDSSEVSAHRERKSVGVERTFAKDIYRFEQLQQKLLELIPELKRRSEKHLSSRTMTKLGVKVKFSDFQQTTKELQSQEIDLRLLLSLLDEALARGQGKAVRLLGVHIGLAATDSAKHQQLALPLS